MAVSFAISRTAPKEFDAIGIGVTSDGQVPKSVGYNRARLAQLGFEGKLGQVAVLPALAGPATIAVGLGERSKVTPASLRTSAASLARAAGKWKRLVTALADVKGLDPFEAAQAVAEGLVLASYKFVNHRSDRSGISAIEQVTLLASDLEHAKAMEDGASRGGAVAEAVNLARDLANTAPAHLNAHDLAEFAVRRGHAMGLTVEVFDEKAIAELRLGGMLAVNSGSTEPPRMVKLTYTPRSWKSTVALVGKGVMYDSGGISLKPSDGMHQYMKMDMTGAAVVLATMLALRATRPRVRVVGYLMCTDNMPSGSAMKLGDVITYRNGRTVEVLNTDAEGRLILADGLSLAVEEGADALVDIATLTGACMVALGNKYAGLMGNHQGWIDQVRAAGDRADERLWQLPLPVEYRKLLDSDVADLKNIGGPNAGALTAGLFLQEFVGAKPWAHLDIAGPMKADGDEGWVAKGATAFGVRTLVELLDRFSPPKG
jgi:leucyl aminopeptidase